MRVPISTKSCKLTNGECQNPFTPNSSHDALSISNMIYLESKKFVSSKNLKSHIRLETQANLLFIQLLGWKISNNFSSASNTNLVTNSNSWTCCHAYTNFAASALEFLTCTGPSCHLQQGKKFLADNTNATKAILIKTKNKFTNLFFILHPNISGFSTAA